jgi:hypothetical protein
MELLAIWQGGLSGVCFALSEMGVEGAGGWGFIGEQGCSGGGGWSGSDGAGDQCFKCLAKHLSGKGLNQLKWL